MKMSELIERHEGSRTSGNFLTTLVRALVKTGKLMHGNYVYSGSFLSGRSKLEKKLIRSVKDARDAAGVDVPWGMFPELPDNGDAEDVNKVLIERFKGFIQDLEPGTVNVERAEDLEGFIERLETLADELRHWGFSRELRERAEQFLKNFKRGRSTGNSSR